MHFSIHFATKRTTLTSRSFKRPHIKGSNKKYFQRLGELFRSLRASQQTQDEIEAHGDVIQVLDYFGRIWTGASKYL
jgi:hypothetical protein